MQPIPSPLRRPADPVPLRRKRVLTDVAKIFSTICNPFVTALTLLVLMTHTLARDTPTFWLLLFVSATFSAIAPMLFVLKMYLDGRISDLDMSIRGEREAVFGTFVIFYFVGTVVLALMHAPTMLIATMAGYTASSLLVQFVTRHWKISTHAIGITAPMLALVVMYGAQPLPFLVLIPIVGWARVYLKAHTVLQVVAGTALGFISVALFFHLFHLI
ncbi:MAG: phosphatase PAP2 family protein [Vulcanimicrobiaceae bacterium]